MQGIRQLMTSGDSEFLVSPLEMAFDGSNREMNAACNLLVRLPCRGV